MRPAAFLDRDGVINVDRGYVGRREDFEFVPGTLEACATLHRMGFALVVVTNQSGIGRGMYSEQDFLDLTDWMRHAFAAAGAPLAGVYYCPHHPQAEDVRYRRACDCRKPAPGMLQAAARELGLDLSRSAIFGDKASDPQAGLAAGLPCRVLLGTNAAAFPAVHLSGATARFRSLAEAAADRALLEHLEALVHDRPAIPAAGL